MPSKILGIFAAKFDACWICGCKHPYLGLQIHHVARGCNRAKSKEEECSLIRTCQPHHDELDGLDVVTQYALIALNNPHAYDRQKLNHLRGRAPDAVGEQEVIIEMVRLIASRSKFGSYRLR